MWIYEDQNLFEMLATIMLLLAVVTFILLNLGLTAPYGKYSLSAGAAWGPGIDGEWTIHLPS